MSDENDGSLTVASNDNSIRHIESPNTNELKFLVFKIRQIICSNNLSPEYDNFDMTPLTQLQEDMDAPRSQEPSDTLEIDKTAESTEETNKNLKKLNCQNVFQKFMQATKYLYNIHYLTYEGMPSYAMDLINANYNDFEESEISAFHFLCKRLGIPFLEITEITNNQDISVASNIDENDSNMGILFKFYLPNLNSHVVPRTLKYRTNETESLIDLRLVSILDNEYAIYAAVQKKRTLTVYQILQYLLLSLDHVLMSKNLEELLQSILDDQNFYLLNTHHASSNSMQILNYTIKYIIKLSKTQNKPPSRLASFKNIKSFKDFQFEKDNRCMSKNSPVTFLYFSSTCKNCKQNENSYVPLSVYNPASKKLNYLIWRAEYDTSRNFVSHCNVKIQGLISRKSLRNVVLLVYSEFKEAEIHNVVTLQRHILDIWLRNGKDFNLDFVHSLHLSKDINESSKEEISFSKHCKAAIQNLILNFDDVNPMTDEFRQTIEMINMYYNTVYAKSDKYSILNVFDNPSKLTECIIHILKG